MEDVEIKNLTGTFLIAVPGLKDPNFERTVVLICEHTKEGAFGLIVNRILMNSFFPVLNWLDIKESVIDLPVFFGGPVRPEQGYMLYVSEVTHYASIRINERLALTTSKEILIDVAKGRGPKKFLFALGFSGWAPGQLDFELMTDSWLVAPLNEKIIFDVPVNERWKAAADLIGVDLARLVSKQGRV